MKVTAIIVAAGVGKRMGQTTPKQFLPLAGQPLLAHTLIPFEAVQEVREIIVLVPTGWEEHCRSVVIEKNGFKKVSKVISGGKERQDSVYIGLMEAATTSGVIVVHDGVRPLITEALIQISIKTAAHCGAAVVAIPLTDTLKQVTLDGLVKRTLKREGLWLVQTPQTFQKKIILEAYAAALRDHFSGTDDAALVERAGFPIKIVPGSAMNLKVTTPEDLRQAEVLLKER
ncbi:MAG: 2-C-methyl-D-erythritol 4-phosphate cytidylyltransferase [Nitrospiria bacterium]